MTHAIAVAQSGDVIQVAAGTYQPGSVTHLPSDPGETFPIAVKEGVSLVGAPFQPNGAAQGTVLLGNGLYTGPATGSIQAALLLKEGASASNLIVRSQGKVGLVSEAAQASITQSFISDNDVGLLLAGSGTAATNNTISGNNTGIKSIGADASRIEGNTITGNSGNDGLGLLISGASPSLRQNSITANPGGGIVIEGVSHPDFGGGGKSDGGNLLSCNNAGDLINNSGQTILARNNLWDHNPPIGNDIVSNSGGTVDTTGAGTVAQPCG